MAGSDDERERRRKDKKKRRRSEDESHSRSREGGRKDRSRSRSADREKKRSSGKRKSAKRSPSGSRSPARSPSKADKARSNGAVKQELPADKRTEPTPASKGDQPRKKSRFAEPAVTIALPQAPAPPTVTAASTAIPSISPAAVSFAAAQAQAKAAEIARRIGVPTGPMGPPPPQPVAAPPVVTPQVFPPTPAVGGAAVAATAAPTLLGMPGQAAALQEQIRRQMEQVQAALRLQQQKEQQQQQQAAAAPTEKKPVFRPMRFDEYGREVDEEGNVIKMDLSGIRTVKVNIAGPTVKEQKEKPAEDENLYLSTADEDDALATLDPRLKMKDRSRRQARAFAFVKPGTFVKQAEKIRDKERSRILAGFASGRNARAYSYSGLIDDGDDSAKGDMPSVVRLQALPAPPEDAVAPVPAMEWWDEAFLPRDKKAVLVKDPSGYDHVLIENSKTYTYVQHPVPLKGMYERKNEEVGMPTFLTKKERKRLRKQARAEREREKRDKIALGLMPAPAPKLNLANFMKVLANESIADPSAVTAKIQAQIEQRKKNHDMRNTARKLTPEEKREKKRKKIVQDKIKQIEVAVFRVRDLSSPKIRYKIDVNAQQTGLSGCVVTCKDPIFGDEGLSLVVVEGGPKAIRRYIKLMIRRIKWDAKDDNDQEEEDDDDDDDDEEDVGRSAANGAKKCEMVWKGIVPKPNFTGFKFQECRTVTTARKVLESRNVAHYWDMVVRAGDGLPPGI